MCCRGVLLLYWICVGCDVYIFGFVVINLSVFNVSICDGFNLFVLVVVFWEVVGVRFGLGVVFGVFGCVDELGVRVGDWDGEVDGVILGMGVVRGVLVGDEESGVGDLVGFGVCVCILGISNVYRKRKRVVYCSDVVVELVVNFLGDVFVILSVLWML